MRNASANTSTPKASSEWWRQLEDADSSGPARSRVWLWRISLGCYTVLLILIAVRAGADEPAGLSIWEAQNTRQLVAWITDAARSALWSALSFVPLGFLVPLSLTADTTPRRFFHNLRTIVLPALALAVALAVGLLSIGPWPSWQPAPKGEF